MARSEREIRIFERFRNSYKGFPSGKVDRIGESPDFIVRYENRVIGIEHTDLYWGNDADRSPFQEGESLRKRVVNQLRELLERSDLPPVWVSVFLNNRAKYSKKTVSGIAVELFTLVEKYLPSLNSQIRLGTEFGWNELPEEVCEFEVRRPQELDFVEVSAPETCWVPDLKKADLERTIKSKEPKLPAYRSRASEIWLLISIDSGSMATWYTNKDHSIYQRFDTKFDQVFVLWVVSGKVVELGIENKTGNM